jgi:hypothetical protein
MNELNLDIYSEGFGEWEENFGEGSWIDTALSLGQKAADANAAKRKAANDRATQAAIMANAQKQAQAQVRRIAPVQDNTMLYVGIGAAILAVLGGAYFFLRPTRG